MNKGLFGFDWRDVLKNEIENVECVAKKTLPPQWRDAPMLVNTVSTVSILSPGYKLPLHTIAAALGPCCQFEPAQFAAAIIKQINSTSDATALVFSSGKMVLTATTTHLHTLYMAHVFRLKIEHIQCVMNIGTKEEEEKEGEGDLVMSSFSGRTVFENLKAHNMVGHGDLGVKVDLRALRNANPDSVKWIPDSFPAAKCCVWLTDDNMCHCNQFKQHNSAASLEDPDVLKIVPKLLRKRCACTIKCLVFPTGRVVMTGGRNMSDINSVFYRMKALAPHFEVGTTIDILVPKDYQVKKKKDDVVISEDVAVDFLLESIYAFKPKRIKRRAVNSANVLLTFAEYGRLSNVKETLSILQTEEGDEMEYVEETISKLSSLERTPEQTRILDFLKEYMKLY